MWWSPVNFDFLFNCNCNNHCPLRVSLLFVNNCIANKRYRGTIIIVFYFVTSAPFNKPFVTKCVDRACECCRLKSKCNYCLQLCCRSELPLSLLNGLEIACGEMELLFDMVLPLPLHFAPWLLNSITDTVWWVHPWKRKGINSLFTWPNN